MPKTSDCRRAKARRKAVSSGPLNGSPSASPRVPPEIWKPVVGYEGLYAVSDRGRVQRVVGGQGARAGHFLMPQVDSRGYYQVRLTRDAEGHARLIHHLVTAAFLGPRPDGQSVHHKNESRRDNRLRNLEYVDRFSHRSHHNKGASNPQAKLTEVDVRCIRKLVKAGRTHQAVADMFDVGRTAVTRIVGRRRWAD